MSAETFAVCRSSAPSTSPAPDPEIKVGKNSLIFCYILKAHYEYSRRP
jgi:hypothetical protein